MALLPEPINDTVSMIYKAKAEQVGQDKPRPHLGASIIGRKCQREIWYSFRWASPQKPDGRMARLFEVGHAAEERLANDLRLIGVTVHTVDKRFITPSNPSPQFRFSFFSGWLGGSMDGCCVGIPEAPKTWHVTEFKTHNDKSFKELSKSGVEKVKFEHYVQMNTYMGWSGMTRALYLAENKNTSELYKERTRFDPALFKATIDKAYNILFGFGIPGRISNDPHSLECGFCDFKLVCHYNQPAVKSCRTCVFWEVNKDGKSYCELDQAHEPLSLDEQIAGCPNYAPLIVDQSD